MRTTIQPLMLWMLPAICLAAPAMPVLDFSTYLGGVGGSVGESVAVDSAGNIYVTGETTSNHFPLANPFREFFYGSNEVFVAKFDPTGSKLIYSTYIGSWGDDHATGIAVDSSGAAYVTGYTTSPEFPLKNPIQSVHAGGAWANGGDAFVFKLSPSGSELEYSTFIGGSRDDWAHGIAVDKDGNAYVVGSTTSEDFPTRGGIQTTHAGGRDVFVFKLNAAGSALLYSTFLGGSGVDEGNSIAVDSEGNAYITGTTTTADFPTVKPFQEKYGGGARDSFIAKLNAEGSALVYSTYVGGTGDDTARGIAVDKDGNAYITGYTTSGTFPNKKRIRGFAGGRDLFVTKLNPEGSDLVYSTFIGGASTDEAFAIAVDAENQVHVAGFSQSLNYPTVNPTQAAVAGNCTRTPCTADVVVTTINAQGSALLYSSYLGGSAADQPRGIAVDRQGNIYLTGYTASTNFPVARAFQRTNTGGGANIAFLVRIKDPKQQNDAKAEQARLERDQSARRRRASQRAGSLIAVQRSRQHSQQPAGDERISDLFQRQVGRERLHGVGDGEPGHLRKQPSPNAETQALLGPGLVLHSFGIDGHKGEGIKPIGQPDEGNITPLLFGHAPEL
jgi:hypothetical protein